MKYKNARNVLPDELIEMIQEYVQGEYVYIPIRDKSITEISTEYKTELEKRNMHIYTKYLEGLSNKRLAEIYNLSESSIRRIIIKQRKGYASMTEKIKEILNSWNLENSEIKQIYDTTWQIEDKYVLKCYSDFEMLERNIMINTTLDEMNIPVGRVISTVDGKQYALCDNSYWFLSEKLNGSNVLKIGNDKAYAYKMGEIIAELHIAFKSCENKAVFWNNSFLDEMNGWVKENFERNGWKCISKDEYEAIISELTGIYDALPVQLIHRDVHFGNFLFNGKDFSGYIDFDLSQRNIRVFDLCYFLLGLLSEKEKFEITNDIWLDLVGCVFESYNKKVSLVEEEKQAVVLVMECIELLFVSYFESVDDTVCAEGAYNIYKFVNQNKERIIKSIS